MADVNIIITYVIFPADYELHERTSGCRRVIVMC